MQLNEGPLHRRDAKSAARQSRNRTGEADRKIEDRKMKTNPIFLSSIFLSFHVLPQPLTSCQLPRSLRAFWTIAVQRLAESSFPLRSSTCLCVSALRPFWLWLRLGRGPAGGRGGGGVRRLAPSTW